MAVPEVLFEDPGSPPEVPPLFVMSFVPGDSLEPLFDLDGEEDEALVAERLRSACLLLASLDGIVPAEVGLGDEPAVGLGEEIDRWVRLLETVDAALAPGWSEIAEALRSATIEPLAPAIVHGDFRLGNMLAVGGEVTALIDWEIWSLGDPRLDLGWFLINADPETYRRVSRYAGRLPTPAELAGLYAEALGRPVPELGFFEALACFKSTATWSLIVKHNRRRSSPDPELEAMAASLPRLLERARELLG